MNMQSGDANRQYLPPEQDEEEEFNRGFGKNDDEDYDDDQDDVEQEEDDEEQDEEEDKDEDEEAVEEEEDDDDDDEEGGGGTEVEQEPPEWVNELGKSRKECGKDAKQAMIAEVKDHKSVLKAMLSTQGEKKKLEALAQVSMKGDVQGRVLAKHIWKLCMLLRGLPRLPANALPTQKKAMKVVKKLIALQQKFEGIAQVKAGGTGSAGGRGANVGGEKHQEKCRKVAELFDGVPTVLVGQSAVECPKGCGMTGQPFTTEIQLMALNGKRKLAYKARRSKGSGNEKPNDDEKQVPMGYKCMASRQNCLGQATGGGCSADCFKLGPLLEKDPHGASGSEICMRLCCRSMCDIMWLDGDH